MDPGVSPPRRAASVVPLTEGPALLWARRSDDAPTLGGFHVAPGGRVEDADATAPREGGEDGEARAAALRELFEEVGILRARGAERLEAAERAALRDALREDVREGLARFAALGLAWRTGELVPIGRWITPSFAPRRFDTSFYALHLEAREEPDPDAFELESAEWIEPARALSRWARGEVLIAPPLAAVLRALERDGRLVAARLLEVRGARGDASQRWEVVPSVQLLPLRTPTLPPATHTNSFLVGSGQAVLVEPATPYREELERAVAWVEEARADGLHPLAIVATHHHADHVGGAIELARRLALPLWAHRLTAERLEGRVRFERHLEDGERIELDGPSPAALRVLHTPGHAPGHVCLIEERSGAMIAGDMVAGEGTILVEPKDGDMSAYLASLERMRAEEPTLLLPAHGGPLRDPGATLAHYVRHRLERERKVLAALGARGASATPSELVPVAYDDAPPVVWPLAALSTEAHLLKLEREGRVRREGDRWAVAP